MTPHPNLARLRIHKAIWESYHSHLLCDSALKFLIELQDRFGKKIAQTRTDDQIEQQAIDTDLNRVYRFRSDRTSQIIRAGDWKIEPSAIPDIMSAPGIILVSPADPAMIVKAITTEKRYNASPIANMIDLEDAFHLDLRKVLEGMEMLCRIKSDNVRLPSKHPSTGVPEILEYRKDVDPPHLVRLRVNGFNTPPVHEILIDGVPIERALFDFGLHFFHIVQGGISCFYGPNYVLPKVDYAKSLIWRDIFEFSERFLRLEPKTIKCSAIIETLKGDFELQEVAFVLAGGTKEHIQALEIGKEVRFASSYIEAFCSGRHDRVFDAMKTFHRYADKTYPESQFTGIRDTGARQSWDQLVAVARVRGLIPVGGMVVALTSDPETREIALKLTEESLRSEHERGSIQAWEAMPDTTDLAMSILLTPPGSDGSFEEFIAPFAHPFGSERIDAILKKEEVVRDRLLTTPKGTVSSKAVCNNINQAIEYIEAWLRGYGVIPFRQKNEPKKPILMQNMATTERARSELWTWIHHRVILSDTKELFTKELFQKFLNQVMSEIEASINEGHIPKGKTSVKKFRDGRYFEAAEILKQVVLSEEFVDTIKYLLLKKYTKSG